MNKLLTILSLTIGLAMFLVFSNGVVQADPCELPDFASASFTDPLTIDNPYWPMVPGTTFVYEPVPNDDDVVNTVTVTNRTKRINVDGKRIRCRVVYDVEEVDGHVTEETWDWYAQDDDRNIWYCGEDTIAYIYNEDDWSLIDTSTEGSWEAGVDGALPGHLILADPSLGACYQQEYYEDVAEDVAKVLRLNAEVTVVYGGPFEDCLETKEWTQLDPGNVEHKYYQKNVGLVLIEELKEKSVRVELVDIIGP